MEHIFAPWRIEWVERDPAAGDNGCPFCVLPERHRDRESRIVARSEHCFVLLNNYPYNPGHVMVIPYAHVSRWDSLDDDALLDHTQLKAATISTIETSLQPDGMNAGENLGGDAAGGSIESHIHTHGVPRWSGDTNFMSAIGDTRVLVEALEDTYDRLYDVFETRPEAAENEDNQGSENAVELRF